MEEPLLPAIIRTSLIFFITYLIWIFTLMFGLMLLLIPGLIILFGTLYIPMRCADQKKWGWGAIFSAVKLALKNPLKTFICWLIVFVVLFCTSFIQGLSNLVLPWEVASVFSSALTICAYTATIIFCTVIYDDIK